MFTLQLDLERVVVLHGYKTEKEALIDHGDKFADRGHLPVFEFASNGLGKFLLDVEEQEKEKNKEKNSIHINMESKTNGSPNYLCFQDDS